MGVLNDPSIPADKTLAFRRLDCISRMGEGAGLWWVAYGSRTAAQAGRHVRRRSRGTALARDLAAVTASRSREHSVDCRPLPAAPLLPRRARPRRASSGVHPVDADEALERQVRVDVHRPRTAAPCARRARRSRRPASRSPSSSHDAADEPVDHRRLPEQQPGLHARPRVRADDVRPAPRGRPSTARRPREQRLGGGLDAGRDRAADVGAVGVDARRASSPCRSRRSRAARRTAASAATALTMRSAPTSCGLS